MGYQPVLSEDPHDEISAGKSVLLTCNYPQSRIRRHSECELKVQ